MDRTLFLVLHQVNTKSTAEHGDKVMCANQTISEFFYLAACAASACAASLAAVASCDFFFAKKLA